MKPVSDRRPRTPTVAALAFAGVASCSGSNAPVYTDRASGLTTFSQVTGTVTVRWSGGTADYVPIRNLAGGAVADGTCVTGLFGNVHGRVEQPETFVAQPGTIMLACKGPEGSWQFVVVTDNLARAQAGDSLKFAPEIRGPTSGCTDNTTPVIGSVSVLEAVGDVDVRTVTVPTNYLRRVHIVGQAGTSSCGLDELKIDVTGEIRPDVFNFSEERSSGKE